MNPDALTPRELEVLAQLARGLTDKQLGIVLGISSITVRNHLASIRSKLDVPNRTKCVLYAIASGLVEAPCGK